MSKPQRRKGNAKNASSSLAHTYLSEGGSGGFIGLTPEVNVFEMGQNMNCESTFSHVDDEARIILRKMMKKDASTREKGLRELVQFMNSNEECVETCYEHFTGIVEHLATDGSATVRLLTMKTVSFFIKKLKKSASKGLKTIIPLVIFNLCDTSNSVCMASENVFKENFENDEKRAQILQIFGTNTIKMAVGIITGEVSEICQAAKYDEEESVEQRKYRLEVQSFGIIQKLSEEKGVEWKESVEKLFENSGFLKNVLKSERYNLKTAVVSVCLKLPNNVEVMIKSPISQWVLDNLDSTNDSICDVAWNAFIVLIGSEKYLSHVSLQKTVLPRVLNVIRKKKNHWNKSARHILPFFATIFDELQKIGGIKPIVESYFDNLPFDSSTTPSTINQWICSFSEISQLILSKENVEKEIVSMVVTAIVKMCRESLSSPDLEKRITTLINWIFEKKCLEKSESLKLCQLVEAVVLEDRERTRKFAEFLLGNGKYEEVAPIHSTLLISSSQTIGLLEILEKSNQAYFELVLKRLPSSVKLCEPTSKWSKKEAVIISKLIVRILKFDKNTNFAVENNSVWRNIMRILLAENDENVWELIREKSKNEKGLFEEMIGSWTNEGDGDTVARIIDFLKSKNIEVDQNEHLKNNRNLDYLFGILKNCTSLKGDVELVHKIFRCVFRVETPISAENMNLLAKSLPTDFEISGFFENLFENEEDCCRVAQIFDELARHLNNAGMIERFLLAEADVYRLLETVKFLEVERLCASTSGCVVIPYDVCGDFDAILDETKLRTFLVNSSRLALFNVSSEYATNSGKIYASIILNISKLLKNRFEFAQIDEDDVIGDQIETQLAKTCIDFRQFLGHPSIILSDVYLSQRGAKLEHLIDDQDTLEMAFAFGMEPKEYLEKMREQMQETAFYGTWRGLRERLGAVLVARAFLTTSCQVLTWDERILVDYLLCGMVTVLDTINDELSKSSTLSPILECLAFYYLQIFAKINKFTNETNEITPIVDEWKEFYLPTLSRIIIDWFGLIKIDSQPTPLIRAIHCALFEIRKFPEDFETITTIQSFLPELDAFDYSPTEQSIISHAFQLIESEIECVQFIGLKMAKLIMPKMFEKENEATLADQKNVEITLDNEKTLKIPAIICRKLNETLESGKMSVVMLFDVCLVPFEMGLSNELRVLYCDALSMYVRPCLSTIIVKQPVGGVAKSKESAYYLDAQSSTASPQYVTKYVCRLLFRTLSHIPAIVRLWFKSLPQSTHEHVRKTITSNSSRLLVENELETVKSSKYANGGDVDLKIRVIPVTGEIVAEYLVEETKMKLTIGLPPDFPLSVPSLHLDKAIVQSDRARKWLVQLNAYLFHQNGAIVEGIELWRNNVDKGVQGAEACCICMMTIHSNTHQLPKVKCKQCKNKFHSNCLYKWFESSNQSSCPLCRANFT